ncbi:MAG: hypothetical protein EOM07_05130 [Clostridia bacterium]|nr:hypothetical protein [Clostridia bacterium]
MGKVTKLINELIQDPSKVELLADILTEADALEKSELEAYALVEKTQASNRSLLQRVAAQPDTPLEEKKPALTAKDITESIVTEMNGGNE